MCSLPAPAAWGQDFRGRNAGYIPCFAYILMVNVHCCWIDLSHLSLEGQWTCLGLLQCPEEVELIRPVSELLADILFWVYSTL